MNEAEEILIATLERLRLELGQMFYELVRTQERAKVLEGRLRQAEAKLASSEDRP